MTHTGLTRFLAIVGALAIGVTGYAQSQAPTFRSGVALVTVDVAVFDKDGRPVPNLGSEAFEVKLNGRVQPVKVVTYLEARGELLPADVATAPSRPPWDGRAGRQTVTNAGVEDPRAPAGEDRVFVILVDDLSIPPTRGQRLLQAARRFVASVPATDPIGVVYSSDPSKPVGPTMDRSAVDKALRAISGSAINLMSLQVQGQSADGNMASPVGLSQAMRIDQGGADALKEAITISCFGGNPAEVDSQVLDVLIATNQCAGRVQREARVMAAQAKQIRANQVGAMEGVIAAMGAASGIRHLVILSDGIVVGREADALQPLAAAAAKAGVQVSVLMEEHDMHADDQAVEGGGAQFGARYSDIGAPKRRMEDQRFLMEGLQTATGVVGGQFYRVVGDPAPFFERVRQASAAVYRIGIELPAGMKVGQPLTVEAMVRHPGASVFVNRHAFVPEAASTAPPVSVSVDERLKDALASGREHGAVPLQAATLLRRAPGASGGLELTISLVVPHSSSGPVRGPVTAMFGLAAAGATAGAALNSGRRVLDAAGTDGVFQTTFGVPVPAAGAYQLRIAVADAEGALGSIAADLDATLPTMGPFAASDLLVVSVDASGQGQLMALDALPRSASGVRAELELYPPASGVALGDVQVEISLSKEGDADPLDDRLVTPRDTSGVWRVATEFAADDLTPGRYTLRARVLVGDDVVGSANATFVKK
jgi:VWFA-related protein